MKAILKLIRADRAMFTVLAIILTTYYIDKTMAFLSLPTILLPVLIQYLAFLINDILDYKTDVRNLRKDRPLVTGEITIDQAYKVMYVLLILTILIFSTSDKYVVIFNLIFLAISILYDLYAKRVVLIGNMLIALTMLAPVLYPYLFYNEKYGYNDKFLELYMYAIFLFGVSRELIKSIEDVEGDRQEGIKTLPVVIGIEKTKIITMILLKFYIILLLLGVTVINNLLATVLIIIISAFTLYLNARLAISNDKREFREIHEKMRWVMFAGILLLAPLSLT